MKLSKLHKSNLIQGKEDLASLALRLHLAEMPTLTNHKSSQWQLNHHTRPITAFRLLVFIFFLLLMSLVLFVGVSLFLHIGFVALDLFCFLLIFFVLILSLRSIPRTIINI